MNQALGTIAGLASDIFFLSELKREQLMCCSMKSVISSEQSSKMSIKKLLGGRRVFHPKSSSEE
jgi:hypothetical protein